MAHPLITAFDGHQPIIGPRVFVDPSARIIGQVELMEGCSVWPGAVLRADDDRIAVFSGSAILDMALLEAPAGKPIVVGPSALISHKACIHGARVEQGALVGIGAIVLDGAVIGKQALVGAGAVVPPGMEVPAGALVLGQPAKVVRELRDEEKATMGAQLAEVAVKAAQYLKMAADG